MIGSLKELQELRTRHLPDIEQRQNSQEHDDEGCYQAMFCTGTGCNSSGSRALIGEMEKQLARHNLEKKVKLVNTGCFGYR